MKKLISLFILTTYCFVVNGQTTKVVSTKYGYSINVPISFSQKPSTRKHIDLNFVDPNGNTIIINVSPREAEEYNYTVHDYTKEALEEGIKQGNPTFAILKAEKLFIGGEKAFLIDYTASAYDAEAFECYIFYNDIVFTITATSTPAEFSKFKTIFLNTIKSLIISK